MSNSVGEREVVSSVSPSVGENEPVLQTGWKLKRDPGLSRLVSQQQK